MAVACTSGTAAAELLPAVIEAREARVPLLVLSADRPAELRENGAGQAIDQLKLFGGAAKWFFEVDVQEADAARAALDPHARVPRLLDGAAKAVPGASTSTSRCASRSSPTAAARGRDRAPRGRPSSAAPRRSRTRRRRPPPSASSCGAHGAA